MPFRRSHSCVCDSHPPLAVWEASCSTLLSAPLRWACQASFTQGGSTEKKILTIRSDYWARLRNSGYFLGGELKCGTPPCLKQVSVVVQIDPRCHWSQKPYRLNTSTAAKAYCPCLYSETTILITILCQRVGKKKGGLSGLFYSLP